MISTIQEPERVQQTCQDFIEINQCVYGPDGPEPSHINGWAIIVGVVLSWALVAALVALGLVVASLL